MRDNLEDTYGFLELQDKILEIMVDIDKLCRENNIQDISNYRFQQARLHQLRQLVRLLVSTV